MVVAVDGYDGIELHVSKHSVGPRRLLVAEAFEDGEPATWIEVNARGAALRHRLPIRFGKFSQDGLTQLIEDCRNDLERYR